MKIPCLEINRPFYRNSVSAKEKHLRIVNFNARSVVNKTDILEIQLLRHDPHIAIITETWLRSDITNELVFPPHYKVFRKDRMHRGGGVAVLVKDQIDATLIGDAPDLECLCVKLSCWGHCFVLYACYRPPDATPDYLIKLQEHMSSYQNKKILLIGDLNLPGVNWELLQANNKSDENANILFDIMLTHDLIQVVNEPTRVQGSSCSVLDVVFLNRAFSEHTVSIEDGLSDHFLVAVSVPIVKIAVRKIPKTISIKDYSRADDARIVDYMETCLTRFADSGSEVSALWAAFTTMCKHCIDTFIPTKSKKVNKSTPWMTRAIIQLKRKIKRIKKKHARTGIISELQEKLACAVRDRKICTSL